MGKNMQITSITDSGSGYQRTDSLLLKEGKTIDWANHWRCYMTLMAPLC